MFKALFIAGALYGAFGGTTYVTEPGLTLPSPHYLRHPPQYIPPTPDSPLPKELKCLEEAAKAYESPTPIMPPLKKGEKPSSVPPDNAEVLRALPRVSSGLPYLYEEFRDGFDIKVEKVNDRLDAPRFFPLIGQAQLHHCHWKCTVTYRETIDAAFPVPFRVQRQCQQVVYIDKNRIYLCASSNDPGPNALCPAGHGNAKSAKSKVVQAGNTEDCEPASKSPRPLKLARSSQMTIGDVVRMSHKNISPEIILRQMELTNAVFNLSVDDIIELHDQGVSDAIIRAMQERRDGNGDPLIRMEQMLIDSENLRQLHDEWRRFWLNDQPSHRTPNRVPGGGERK